MENEVVNIDDALSRIDGDRELFRELASLFLENYSTQLAEIQSAIAQNNSMGIERAAHTMKGSVATFSAKPAFEAALRLEIMGRENNLAGVKEVYTTLEKELERLRPNLEAIMSEP